MTQTPPANPPEPGDATAQESVYRGNLDAFGGRATRACGLLRRGRISPDRCFLALMQLWMQLVNARSALDNQRDEARRPGGDPVDSRGPAPGGSGDGP